MAIVSRPQSWLRSEWLCGRSRTTAGFLCHVSLGTEWPRCLLNTIPGSCYTGAHGDRGHGRSLCRGGNAEQSGTTHREGICPCAERRERPDLHGVWGRPQVSDEKLTRGETWFGGEERLFEVRQMAHLFIFIRCFLNLCCGPSTVRSSRMKWADVAGAEAGGNQRTIPSLSGPHTVEERTALHGEGRGSPQS